MPVLFHVIAKQLIKDLYSRPAIMSSKPDITVFDHINNMIFFMFRAYCVNCPKNPLPLNKYEEKDLLNAAHRRIIRFAIELLSEISSYSPTMKLITLDSTVREQDKIFEFQDHFTYEYQLKSVYLNVFNRLDKFYTDILQGLLPRDGTPTSSYIDIINCFINRLSIALTR